MKWLSYLATVLFGNLLLSKLLFADFQGSRSNRLSEKFIENAQVHAYQANGDYEPAVLTIIEDLQNGQLEAALQSVNQHLEKFPKSQVGHLLKADILSALTGELNAVGSGSSIPAEQLEGLKHQLRVRWQHAAHDEKIVHQRFPASLLDMGDNEFVVIANKTPIGVYNINRYIEGRALPDLYGKGAFPVNYPNRYDRYLNRTGYGIWLHGTPSDTYARSPWSSEGCFVLSNDDLLDIGRYVSAEKRTPVILSDGIEWVSLEELQKRRQSLLQVVEQWKNDWESLNIPAYINHYQQRDFNLGKGDFKLWSKRKYRVNEMKSFVQVDLDIKSLFAYPGETDMFFVSYQQHYISDNFVGESFKEQLWKRDKQGQWKIIFEG